MATIFHHTYTHKPDGVVGGAANHKSVSILQTGDSALVTVQSAHKLTSACAPYLQER